MPFILGLLQGCGPGGKGAGVMRVTTPQPSFPSDRQSQGGDFRINPGDVLGFVFVNNPELNTEQAVRTDGKITLKLIGEVVAAGLTPAELEDAVLRRYVEFVANSNYTKVLKEGDFFELRFVYNPELNIGVRIRADGKVSLPLIGDIQAAGITPGEFRKILVRRYSKDINKPDIALLVGENTSKPINTSEHALALSVNRSTGHRCYVMGEVKQPKGVTMDLKITMYQALAEAGGATELGDLARVVVIRRTADRKIEWLQMDLESPLESIDMRNDLYVHADDIIVVPKTGIAKANQWVRQYIRDLLPVATNFNIDANLLGTAIVP